MRTSCWVVAVWMLIGAVREAGAQPPGFQRYQDDSRGFSIDFPVQWNWQYVPGSGEPVALLESPYEKSINGNRAAVVVERFRLSERLAADEITDVFVEIEQKHIKEGQPSAVISSAKLTNAFGRRVIEIQYDRTGPQGARQHVRHYSFPIEQDLYRVTCMASPSDFASFSALFDQIVGSLRPLGSPR
jgi:hypothetical protein